MNARKLLKQARSAALKARKARRQKIAAELQQNLEDRAAARRLLEELAGYERDRRRIAATLRAKVKPEAPARQASGVAKRRTALRSSVVRTPTPQSSWVVDDLGMRGVSYHQSYLNRKSPAFYRGAAADRWIYDARDEAVMRDADGNVIWFSNLGHDVDEVAAAWQSIEDATTRRNGKVQIRNIVPLDADASPEEQAAALRHFCEHVLRPLDLPYSAVLHHPPDGGDQRNTHGHILTNLRPIEHVAPYTWAFADEIRGELDGKNGVQMLRHLWAWSMTEAARQADRPMHYTGLSYTARGLPLEVGEHLGEDRSAMVARGERVWAHERNRLKSARNAQRLIMRDLDRKIAALEQLRETLVADGERPVAREPRQVLQVSNHHRLPPDRLHVSRPPSASTRLTVADEPGRPEPLVVAPSMPVRPRSVMTSRGADLAAGTRKGNTAQPIVALAASLPPRIVKPLQRTDQPRQADSEGMPLSAAHPITVPPQPIIETMAETIRRLAQRRVTRSRDPAAIAWRQRRAIMGRLAADAPVTPPATRLWFELNPMVPFTRATRALSRRRDRQVLERIAASGGYVSPGPDGVLVQHIRTPDVAVPEEEWWAQRHVQHTLADLRRRQQLMMAGAIRSSGLTIGRLDRDRPIPWTMAVATVDRERLARWAECPAFHDELIEKVRHITDPQNASTAKQATGLAMPPGARAIPDGFGGWRDSPAPAHSGPSSPVRLKPFDAAGAPTDHLLRLLDLVGRNPDRIAIATDGRPIVQGKAPRLLLPLLHGWRQDERVVALVVETVRLTRTAGEPTWPDSVAHAVRRHATGEAEASRAMTGRTARRLLSDPDRDRSR